MPSPLIARAVRRHLRRPVCAAASLLAVAGAVRAESQGLARTIMVDIGPQKVSTALLELSRQAEIQVLMPGLVADERATQGVHGRMSVGEALTRLLEGTSLKYRIAGDNIIGIEVVGSEGQPVESGALSREGADRLRLADGSFRLAQNAPTDAAQSGAKSSDDTLQEVVVTSKILFRENDAFGATKMGIPLKDTPQSITVVTSDVIDFAGMRTFNDFYKVDADGGTSHAIDGFPRNYYRGFRQQGENAIRVDGFRMPGNIDLDFATFDRFEVIKGPTSTLYGQNSIGGTLNAVSKLPQDRFGMELGLEGGQFDDYRGDVDLTGPFRAGSAWSYRLVGAYEDEQSFLDFANEDLALLSPSIQFQPDDSTRFVLRAIYQKSDKRIHFAPSLQLGGTGDSAVESLEERVANEGLKDPDVPRSRFFGMPWNETHIEAKFVQFQGEHRFDNHWTLRGHLQHNDVRYRSNALFVQGPFDQDGFAYFTSVYGQDTDDSLYGAELNLFGDFEAFGRRHTLFFGVDYNRIESTSRLGVTATSVGFADSVFNMFTPDYASVPPYDRLDDYDYLYDFKGETALFGGTVQLITRPTDRLSLLLGARYSVDTVNDRDRGGPPTGEGNVDTVPFQTSADAIFHQIVYQAGLTYAITPSTNLYASFGQTFEPGTDRRIDESDPDGPGILIQPERGRNHEIGFKADLSRELSITGAVFDMERTNISQADRDNPGFSVALGTQRSRGVELGMQGQLLPPLSLLVSVAYLDAKFIQGEFKGLTPENAPRFGLSAFASYELLQGGLKGLGFGLGVVHKAGRKTFDSDWASDGLRYQYDFGDFTEVDARIFYSRDRWSYAISATNLFDEKYYSPTFTDLDFATHVNPPRTIRASVRYKF